ncbi:cation-translocating P-type ATPase [Streptomyces mobaraensis NBRC 13819 = DSM 40847]|uniref:cation-translocating P-type ATPase n=1 Tax=Streptomyces mobaraensis TaxID=35621 RepID=UPI001B307ABD|nr:cation-translocating P-type ATPase [Streptomyces mobaraensis]QTT77048.1 cation-translocating P-type ATPase [Streptomyces mobaraensis NBRC 13819 = DSM 40847]
MCAPLASPADGRGPEVHSEVQEVPVGSWSALVPALVGTALRAGPVRAWDTAAGALDWGRRTAGEALSSLTTAVAAGLTEAGAALAEGGRDRTRRRMWTGGGRIHLEVRGLGRGERHDRLAATLCEALQRLEGVNWAEVNAVLGHLVIDADEDRLDPADVLELVEGLEEEHLAAGAFDADRPRPPFDTVPATLTKVALAADCVGLVCATARRLSPLPALPPALRLPVVLAETQPRLRRLLEDRLGREHADVLLAASNAAAHALTRGVGPLGLDLVHRVWRLAEIRARQDVWALREPELVGDGGDLPRRAPERTGRPVPLPEGPVESCGRRTALTALLGAGGLLAWTRDPERAARTVVSTAPKAAEAGREAFAARLGRDLARAGALPLDPGALRRLDRVTTVLFDAPVLCAPRPRLLSAVATGELDEAALWSAAHRVLARFAVAELCGPGPWAAGDWRLVRARDAPAGRPDAAGGLALDLWGPDGTRAGRVLVGCALDPLADALLAVARGPTRRVLLTEHVSAAELLPRAHRTVPARVPLCEEVRRLQRDGEVVLLVARGDACRDEDAAAADVTVTVPPRAGAPGGPCWSADLVCGPGTALVWRTLAALEPAREVSAASARLSLGGSLLGALIATGGARGGRTGLATSPVHGAALLAMAGGVLAARRVAGRPLPPGRVRGTWHALGAWETLSMLRASDGLDRPAPPRPARRPVPLTAAARGPGRLLGAVREELRDPLTPVLTLGAAASVAVGSTVDSALVGGVMTGNALISGVQRLRAERALSGLLLAERPTAHRLSWSPGPSGAAPDALLRSMAAAPVRTVPADELRAGDVVALGPTDVVPADARLLAADRLELDESPLTGESAPVPKDTRATPGADLADRSCMVYQGCTVLAGSGYAVVTATGAQTEAGRAADLVGEATAAPGIEAHLAALTRAALPAVGVGGGAVTLLGLVRGVPLRQAVASGVAIAVAAVPEGLPLVATVAQSAAARRLSRHGVLTRSARALEALGRVDTVCFDKTGTLTRGRLSVTRVALPGQDPPPLDNPAARRLLRTAARACPPPVPDRPPPHATDRAVLDAATAHGTPDAAWRLTAELPFETARGYSASLGTDDGTPLLVVKGAPETVLARCATVTTGDGTTAPLDAERLRAAQESVQELARDGLRVLAVAEARPAGAGDGRGPSAGRGRGDGARLAGTAVPGGGRSADAAGVGSRHAATAGAEGGAQLATPRCAETRPTVMARGQASRAAAGPGGGAGRAGTDPDGDDARTAATGPGDAAEPGGADGGGAEPELTELVRDLTLLGFLALADTPRPGAAEAVRRLTEAGTRVVMITGDHPATAAAVARELGVPAGEVVTGPQLDTLPEPARTARVAGATVFARVSPEQKAGIVHALRSAGRVVAMAGDGINDAAAIRLADVGIGLSAHGSTSARAAADLVLAEPDPRRIVAALLEGRALWRSVRDAVAVLVGGNAGEVAFTVLGTALSGRAPLGTRQFLLVNLLTDMLPALAIAVARTGAAEDDDLAAGPVPAPLGRELARALAVRGTATALGAAAAWQCGRATGRAGRASTMGLAALVLTQLGQTLTTDWRSPLVLTTAGLSALALVGVVQTPGVSHFFGCCPLGPVAWGTVLGTSAAATFAAALAPRLLGEDGDGDRATGTPPPPPTDDHPPHPGRPSSGAAPERGARWSPVG